MASTVKKSLAKSKNKESNMANDDFYKEAQRQHLRELLEAQQNENNQQEEEQQAAPPPEEAPVPATQPVETPVVAQPPPVQTESVQQTSAPSLNYQPQNAAPTIEDDDDFDFDYDYDYDHDYDDDHDWDKFSGGMTSLIFPKTQGFFREMEARGGFWVCKVYFRLIRLHRLPFSDISIHFP